MNDIERVRCTAVLDSWARAAFLPPADLARLVAGLREILDEHHPHQGYDDPITFCVACGGNPSHGSEWPCGTVRSVASALGVEETER